ncbi:MAG: presqualene diphosphate synthase HpnD [Gammaproteobacteria bacterium]
MTPEQYCEQKTASSGSSFSFSFLFLEPEQRQAMTTLYAYCREIDDVVDECSDEGIARTKLAWWRDEVARSFAGSPQHPVGKALLSVIARYELPQEHFQEIIDGMEMDLDYNAYRTFKELSLYCYRAASVVGLMAAEIFGYEDRRTLKYAHDLGMAFQLTNILRDVAEDARRGRVYIPEEDMDRFKVSRDDILHGRLDDNMRALLKFEGERAKQYYQQAFGHLPDSDRYRQRSGLIMAAVYQALIKAMEDHDYRIFEQRINLSPPRKMYIAWQTARREKRRELERDS